MTAMTTADILRLPGVGAAREALIDNGGWARDPHGQEHAVIIDERYVDDLILAVAEAVEAKERERCARGDLIHLHEEVTRLRSFVGHVARNDQSMSTRCAAEAALEPIERKT